MFTQTLICNDKINDGAYFAIETNFPEGTIANLGDAEGSTGIAWAFLQPVLHRLPADDLAGAPGARLHRGDHRRLLGARATSLQGGGIDQYGQLLGDHELRDRRPGAWAASTCSTAPTTLRRDVQPRGRHGRRRDVGADLADRLPRRAGSRPTPAGRAATAAAPPSSRCCIVHEDAVLGDPEHRHRRGCSPRRGSSAATRVAPAYVHNIRGADLLERARRGRGLPGRRRRLRRPGADGDRGRARVQAGQLHDARADRRRRPLPAP